jgi:hypothetical protein
MPAKWIAATLVAFVWSASAASAAETITVGDTALIHPSGGVLPGLLEVETPGDWWQTAHDGTLQGSGFSWSYEPENSPSGYSHTFLIDNQASPTLRKVITITIEAHDPWAPEPGTELPKYANPTDNDFWIAAPVVLNWPPPYLMGASNLRLQPNGNWSGQFQFGIKPQPAFEYVVFNLEDIGLTNIVRTSIEISCVPEPGTWAMLIVGFGGVGAALRRRRVAAVTG